MTKSSAFESLTNEGDVSNYQSHFRMSYKKQGVFFPEIIKVALD
jgi:hypothetical protein